MIVVKPTNTTTHTHSPSPPSSCPCVPACMGSGEAITRRSTIFVNGRGQATWMFFFFFLNPTSLYTRLTQPVMHKPLRLKTINAARRKRRYETGERKLPVCLVRYLLRCRSVCLGKQDQQQLVSHA